MRVEDFKSNFKEGARPNLYRFEVDGLPEKLVFVAKTSQLPGRNIGPIEIPFLNKKIKAAGDSTYDDLTVTISIDSDFAVKNELEEWLDLVDENGAVNGSEMAHYKREATVVQLDRRGNEIAIYKFVGIFPNNMAPVELGFEQSDTIEEMSVTFSYDYWVREK